MATVSEAIQIALDHHEAGRLDEAEAIYRQILAAEPQNIAAWHLLGRLAEDAGDLEVARACIARAIQLNPNYAAGHLDLGSVLYRQGKLNEAAVSLTSTLHLNPHSWQAENNLGNVLKAQGKLNAAAAHYRRAAEINSQSADIHNNLGGVLLDLGMLDEAIVSSEMALELNPLYEEAHINIGNALKAQGNLASALAHFRKALEINPNRIKAHDNLVYSLYFAPGYDAQAIYEEHQRWNERHAAPLASSIQPHANDRAPDRRLKIGFVSPDFREHVQAHFTLPLFAAHDRRELEFVGYGDVFQPDEFTSRLRSAADAWRDITGRSDEYVAELVRQDKIDILVDLTMHMAHSRLLVFARKPAPVQVTWLAYPGTTGLTAIDYRLTDSHLDPPGMFDGFYSEQSFRLPDTFWCYDPLTAEPKVNELPALTRGYVTFANLNNFCKLNEDVLRRWARVLHAAQGSRLMLLAPEGSCRRWVSDVLKRAGISPERIEFLSRQPRPAYLQTYHKIDVVLDTVPYNGHTTSLDAAWMGVPTVTLVGPTVVGRAGLSQCTNLDLTELVAHTDDDFVRIAAGLASDLARLAGLRAGLRSRLERSPLMNAPLFARNVESAFRTMWRRWCNNEPQGRPPTPSGPEVQADEPSCSSPSPAAPQTPAAPK